MDQVRCGVRMVVRGCRAATVVTVHGPVRVGDLRIHRAAVSQALAGGPPRIVLDLAHAVLDEESLPVLAQMGRYVARHEGALWLAAVPSHARDLVAAADGVATAPRVPFRVLPTVAIALALASTVPLPCRGPARTGERGRTP